MDREAPQKILRTSGRGLKTLPRPIAVRNPVSIAMSLRSGRGGHNKKRNKVTKKDVDKMNEL
jgi:hypothetical protein